MRRVALWIVVAPAAVSLAAQDDLQDKTREYLDEAVKEYKQTVIARDQGKDAEALAHVKAAYELFEKAVQGKPSSDIAYAWLKRTGEDLVFGMMNDPDRKIRDLGRRLLLLAQPGTAFGVDAKVIKAMLANLRPDQPWDVQRAAHYHLVAYGPFALQYLLPVLNDASNDVLRARVHLVLREIGSEITLGVAQALSSEREQFKLLRQNACISLGNIGDERAIPALKRAFEDANEYPEVKREAFIALARLTGKNRAEEWKKATEYYYELAKKFFYNQPEAIHSWERSYKYWKWDKEKNVLTQRRVPRFAFGRQLSEEALYDLLELDPEFPGAWSLLIMAFVSQKLEADVAIRQAEEAKTLDELEEADLADLKEVRMKNIERVNVLAEMIGLAPVYEGIRRSMDDGSPPLAEALIEIVREKGKVEDLPGAVETGVLNPAKEGEEKTQAAPSRESYIGYPLVQALTYFDKRVRYAAARAMLLIAPREKRLGWELVIPNLADALGETGVRVALIVYDVRTEDDYAIINRLRKVFLSVNTFPVIARSAGEGLVKAREFPNQDVIFIQYKVASQLYVREQVADKKLVEESVFDALRDDVRTRHIPKFIIAETDDEAKSSAEIYKSHIQGVIKPDIDRLELEKLLEILKFERAMKEAKARADEMARRAAEALDQAEVDTVIYPVHDSVPALIKAATPEVRREVPIRVPAISALGKIGDTRAVDVLVKILDDKPQDAELAKLELKVRQTSAKALSRIFKRNRYTPSEEIIDSLRKWLDDGDYVLEETLGEAFGNANLKNAKRMILEVLKRKSSFNGRLGKIAEDIEKDGKD